MEQVRSFIAIELPSGVRAELASLEERLKAVRFSFVKWVDPENIHLTLKFLGGVSAETLPKITKAMAEIAQKVHPFCLHVEGLGAFPNWQRPQVVWVGIGGEIKTLAALQKDIEASLSPLGFPPESRSFSPHLTLGRLRERVTPIERQDFAEWVNSIKFETGLPFEVNTLSLMKSQLTPRGAIYSQIAIAELQRQPAN